MIRSSLVRRVGSAIAASTVAVAAFVVFTAAPASAAYPDCAVTGYNCVYKNANGASGGVKVYPGNDGQYSDNNFSSCTLNCNVNDN